MDYEYVGPLQFGIAGAGTFQIISPWSTPCEVCVLVLTLNGGGGLSVRLDGSPPLTMTPTTAPNGGGASGIDLYSAAPGGPLVLPPLFMPFSHATSTASWAPVTAGHSASVVLLFRRASTLTRPSPYPPFEVAAPDEQQYHAIAARQAAEAAQDLPQKASKRHG